MFYNLTLFASLSSISVYVFCVAAYLSVFVVFVFSCESATCVHLELCVYVSHICKSLLHFFQYFRVSMQAAFFAL